jgi:NADPH:quinone reductase-like Zn-dependent oxidoreductase
LPALIIYLYESYFFSHYGDPEVLKLGEVPKPTPKDNEILIKIFATAVNTADCRFRRADPWLVRLFLGLTKPRISVLGGVFSGEVVETGKDVTKYKVGDKVFGSTGLSLGGYSEYKCLVENAIITTKPETMSHTDASTIPFGGLTGLYFVQKVNLQKSQKVLVYGASGSVGSSIVQLAKYYGADVTGVCSTKNIKLVKSLGADDVIDYTKEDFTKNEMVYDVIFETVNKLSFKYCFKALKKDGILVLSAAGFVDMFKGIWTDLTGKQKVISGTFFEKTESLELLKSLIQSGDYKPIVDKIYDFKDMADAHKYVENGHKAGNVAISVVS